MRSLTGTLFRGVIMTTAPILVLAGTVLYLSVSAQLVRQIDESLTDKAKMLALSVEEKQYGLEVDLEETRIGNMEESDSPEYLYIGSLEGRTFYRSNALDGIPIPSSPGPLPGEQHDWYRLPDDRKLRSVLFSFAPEADGEEEDLESIAADSGIIVDTLSAPGDHVVIQLFRDTSSHSRFMETFFLMLLATGLGSIGILSLTVWMSIKKGANPVNELAAHIEGISDDLGVRIDEVAVLKELVPIVHKLNNFLDKLEESFSRERGFTSDAAHELRTPLAGLRSTIEVALGKERESEEYRTTLVRALEIVKQLESLVGGLLALARLESGQEKARISEVNLENCIQDTWKSYSKIVDKKDISVSFSLSNGEVALIDKGLLVQVLEELFRNALYYVDQGGSVRVNLLQEEGNTQLRISNTGSKISVQDTARVFDRFWRGSQFKDDTGLRFGLGLPISRKIVEMMGMRMDVKSEMDGEFVVTLTMKGG